MVVVVTALAAWAIVDYTSTGGCTLPMFGVRLRRSNGLTFEPKITIQLQSRTGPTVTRLELCDYVACTDGEETWVNRTVYLCRFDIGRPQGGRKWCAEHPFLYWRTEGKEYAPSFNPPMVDFKRSIVLKRDRSFKKGDRLNPIEITIRMPGTRLWPDLKDHYFLVLGVETDGLGDGDPRVLMRVNYPVEVKEPEKDAVEKEWDQRSDVIFDARPIVDVQSFEFDMCEFVTCVVDGRDKNDLPIQMWVFDKGYPRVLDEGCSDRELLLWRNRFSLKGRHQIPDKDKLELRTRIRISRKPMDGVPGNIVLTVIWKPGTLSPWKTHYVYLGVGTEPLTGSDSVIVKINLNVPVDSDKPEVGQATGFLQKNFWMLWIQSTAHSVTNDSCVACARSRPELKTIPSPFSENQTFCVMHLHMTENPISDCRWLEKSYPLASAKVVPPIFTPVQSRHLCLRRTGRMGLKVGHLNTKWCFQVLDVSSWVNATQLVVARSDLYWYCGQRTLLNVLSHDWLGTCTILSLLAPLTIVPATVDDVLKWRSGVAAQMDQDQMQRRRKRAISASFDLYGSSPVYIDAIGVPRGVPEQYKLADEIASGFESLIPQVTINKNVARINYVHFSVQRLTNFTRDAIEGIHGQLSATSLMAEQNRMALDFLLAETGGTCALIGAQCCTWIPKHTDNSTGSIVRALNGLRGLSVELADHSGTDTSLNRWLRRAFGEWKQTIVTALLAFCAAFVVIMLVGCCCIPCIRILVLRCLESAIDARNVIKPQHMMVQFQVPTAPPVSTGYEVALEGLMSSYTPDM